MALTHVSRFNPRARVGRDALAIFAETSPGVFQSTRPRGARPNCRRIFARYRDVSIHAPAWGATSSVAARRPSSRCFNPRARVGRDRCAACYRPARILFQSTRPRGARHSEVNPKCKTLTFQSTRPRGARPAAGSMAGAGLLFQSTRPRGARRVAGGRVYADKEFQSTRPRGARPRAHPGWRRLPQFQSTRPRGARPHPQRTTARRAAAFQSTRPRGARPDSRPDGTRLQPVSIHAPAWGATGQGPLG